MNFVLRSMTCVLNRLIVALTCRMREFSAALLTNAIKHTHIHICALAIYVRLRDWGLTINEINLINSNLFDLQIFEEIHQKSINHRRIHLSLNFRVLRSCLLLWWCSSLSARLLNGTVGKGTDHRIYRYIWSRDVCLLLLLRMAFFGEAICFRWAVRSYIASRCVCVCVFG